MGDYFSDDFATARPTATKIELAIDAAANENNIAYRDLKYFDQGFVHAVQGRTDLVGQNSVYDLGYQKGCQY